MTTGPQVPDVFNCEILRQAGVEPPEDPHRTPVECLGVCIAGNRSVNAVNMELQNISALQEHMSGSFLWISAPHSAHPPVRAVPALCLNIHLPVDHKQTDGQEAAGEAGENNIKHLEHYYSLSTQTIAPQVILLSNFSKQSLALSDTV